MNSEKYIGLDVHQATVVVAVMDSTGKLVMESMLETEAATILQFFAGLRGNLSLTFEEGTWSVWLYYLLNPHVDKLVLCNPRKNSLLKDRNKSEPHRCAQAGGTVTRQSAQTGLPSLDAEDSRHLYHTGNVPAAVTQVLQQVQLLIESFGSTPHAASRILASY